MAENFKDASRCPICLVYLDKPMYLKCGNICCFQCINSLQKEPHGEGLLCPTCPVVSQKNDIRPSCQLGELVSKVKDLEPHLRALLKMNPRMLQFQVDVTLDVNTANSNLIISDDLRRVKCGYFKKNLEDRVERHRAICVLGKPQFTSGRHYWEVDVGTSKEWELGLCKKSVPRQQEIVLCSEHGFWTVGLINGELYSASTTPLTPLQVNSRLHRVGIFLDMDIGNISFCDIRDGSHIFTFTNIPTADPLRPFFAPCNAGQDFLSICPVMNVGNAMALVCPEQDK